MTKTQQFYLTFGQKYRTIHHLKRKEAHPDGYAVIHAEDEYEARKLAIQTLWWERSGLYTHDKFFKDPIRTNEMYPKGVLFELS